MLNRRVEKGQCFQRPSLGCREFAAHFEPATPGERPAPLNEDIGRMLYDIVFGADSNRAVFFSARIVDGVMDTRPESVLQPAVCQEVLRCSYRR